MCDCTHLPQRPDRRVVPSVRETHGGLAGELEVAVGEQQWSRCALIRRVAGGWLRADRPRVVSAFRREFAQANDQ